MTRTFLTLGPGGLSLEWSNNDAPVPDPLTRALDAAVQALEYLTHRGLAANLPSYVHAARSANACLAELRESVKQGAESEPAREWPTELARALSEAVDGLKRTVRIAEETGEGRIAGRARPSLYVVSRLADEAAHEPLRCEWCKAVDGDIHSALCRVRLGARGGSSSVGEREAHALLDRVITEAARTISPELRADIDRALDRARGGSST